MEPLTKMLVIGVDGGETALFEQWMHTGDMPNLKALRDRGLWGRTKNPDGLEAGAVWPTFHTGLKPGHQPQYDGQRHFDSKIYQDRWYELDEVEPSLWRHLSNQGKRVLVIDAPYVRLDPNVNGAMILDWGGHVAANGTTMQFQTHPAELADEILNVVGPDPTGGVVCDVRKKESVEDWKAFISDYMDRIPKKAKMTVHMLKKGNWDYAETVFTDLHSTGHHLWHINDPMHPKYDPKLEKALGEPLRDLYRAFDKALGEILAVVDERTDVMFYTSHGMGPQYTASGLLDRILDHIEHNKRSENKRPVKARITEVWHKVPGDVRAMLRPLRKPFKGSLAVKAFLTNRAERKFFEVYANNATGGVRINLKGREAQGIVPKEDYRMHLETIAKALMTFTNVDTGEPLVKEIIFTQDRYDGAHVDRLPDLLVSWNRNAAIKTVESPEYGTFHYDFHNYRTGDHTPFGMFIATGASIPARALNGDTDATDFAPTIWSRLGAEPGPTDGQPIPGMDRVA